MSQDDQEDDASTDDALSSDTEATCDATNNQFSVFISYRVNPDESLAIALKKLIEGSIRPKPKVFVSGAGGLRPSKTGSMPQILSAVESSSAFIAIITQESKNREWIFFEAGAAFGRKQLYAPLLVDTVPSDLASSIAGYQAVRASKIEECKQLVQSIAQAIGSEVKSRFRPRYLNFEREFQSYSSSSEVEEISSDDQSPLGRAVELLKDGEIEEANKIFTQLEESAETNEAKAKIRMANIGNSNLSHAQLLHSIEDLEKKLGETGVTQFWLGIYENRSSAAVRYFENCLSLLPSEGYETFRNGAIIEIAEESYMAANYQIAYKKFSEAFSDGARSLRSKAVIAWSKLKHSPSPLEKMLILSSGLLDDPESKVMLEKLVKLSNTEEWRELLIYFARRFGTKSGLSANSLGIAYETLKLYSLAYLAYSDSAEMGVSVAKANMARLTKSTAIPSAGLKLLQDHTGRYDSTDAGYPYRLRGELEKMVQDEEKKAEKKAELGQRLFTALSNFGWEAIRGSIDIEGCFQFGTSVGVFAKLENDLSLKIDDNLFILTAVGETVPVLLCKPEIPETTESNETRLFIRQEDGSVLELVVNLSDASVIPETVVHIESPPSVADTVTTNTPVLLDSPAITDPPKTENNVVEPTKTN